MSQVTNLAFFRARRGQSEALGAALAALVEPTRLEADASTMICTGPSMIPMSGLFLQLDACRGCGVHANRVFGKVNQVPSELNY